MKSINEISNSISRSVKGFFSDIDDTITTDGMLSGDAYVAIENISNKGIHFVPITGRPAGWCDMIARFWPVNGVIGENGAFYFSYDHRKKKLSGDIFKMKKFALMDKKNFLKLNIRFSMTYQVAQFPVTNFLAYLILQ